MSLPARQTPVHFKRDRDDSEKELSLARYVMGNLIRGIQADPEMFQHWLLPATEFSGDVISARMTEGGRFHVLLADAAGHGLSAALCVMPVSEVFYAMTDKGFPVGSIARELNQKMHGLLPRDRFVAATLASIDPANRTIEIWNGGGPTAVFLSEDGCLLKSWKSLHLPIGVLSDTQFDEKTACFRWDKAGQLYLYSDGLIDARDQHGTSFGVGRLRRNLLGVEVPRRFGNLKDAVLRHLGGGEAEDDISFVSVHCPMGPQRNPSTDKHSDSAQSRGLRDWKIVLRLDETDIQKNDVLPILLTWLKQAGVGPRDTQSLVLVLTELYTNAVDHGLLRLDSRLKSSASGFEDYLECRAKRLADLKSARIEIVMTRTFESKEDLIKIRIEDSGQGFDFQTHFKTRDAGWSVPSGKGMTLIHALSRKVTYLDRGNAVEVEYLLNRP